MLEQKKDFKRKVISYVLMLIMMLSTLTGIIPGTSMKVRAENVSYYKLTFTGSNGYLVRGPETLPYQISLSSLVAPCYHLSGWNFSQA